MKKPGEAGGGLCWLQAPGMPPFLACLPELFRRRSHLKSHIALCHAPAGFIQRGLCGGYAPLESIHCGWFESSRHAVLVRIATPSLCYAAHTRSQRRPVARVPSLRGPSASGARPGHCPRHSPAVSYTLAAAAVPQASVHVVPSLQQPTAFTQTLPDLPVARSRWLDRLRNPPGWERGMHDEPAP